MLRPPPRPTLSLHDALPICRPFQWTTMTKLKTCCSEAKRKVDGKLTDHRQAGPITLPNPWPASHRNTLSGFFRVRSEEHTSELQSHVNLVCRLLLEKKKKNN